MDYVQNGWFQYSCNPVIKSVMQFFQVFFNANECDRTGKPGFGIRTATVGTPESWLQALNHDQQLRNYLSGTFEINARDILANPGKIMAYPRTYYFKKLRTDDGQEFYAIGRIVYACFDFPFYRSGTLTRPGNLINHILLFDSAPSREVFDLFFEQPQTQSFRFLPADYTPRTDNAEMTALMLGKSEPLPVEPLQVAVAADVRIPPESYKLYFQLIDLLANRVTETESPKPIVIKAPAAQSSSILAGLMRLLPDELLPQMTFFANHQENGALKGVKLTVINEYYPFQVYTATCHFIDLTQPVKATQLEEVYSERLQAAAEDQDITLLSLLRDWVPSSFATQYLGLPVEQSGAMFGYIKQPELFQLDAVESVPGLKETLAQYIGKDAARGNRLNELLCERMGKADTVEEWKTVIATCESLSGLGVNIQVAIDLAQKELSQFVASSASHLLALHMQLGSIVLDKYCDKSQIPALTKSWDKIEDIDASFEAKRSLMAYLEPSAQKRVNVFAQAVKKDTGNYRALAPFIEAEKEAADAFDWFGTLQGTLESPDLTDLLFRQSVLLSHGRPDAEDKLIYWAARAQQDTYFKELLIQHADMAGYYTRTLDALMHRKDALSKEQLFQAIDTVLGVFPQETSTWKTWNIYRHVVSGEVLKNDIVSYYTMAKKADEREALKNALRPCIATFRSEAEIEDLVSLVLERELTDLESLIADVCAIPSLNLETKVLYWKRIASEEAYDATVYSSMRHLAIALGVEEQAIDKVIEEAFPKAWSDYKKKARIERVKGFFRNPFGKKEEQEQSDK